MNHEMDVQGMKALAVRAAPAGTGPNPAVVYTASKAEGSRAAVRSALCKLAGWLLGRDRPATWDEASALPWWEVRARHVAVLRARLVEHAAPRTVNRDLSILRSVLKTAWRNDQMDTDAYMKATAEPGVGPDSTKSGRALDPAEVRTLLTTCEEMGPPAGPRAAAILALMYGAGLRRIQIARLDVADVNLDSGAVTNVGKRAKRHVAYLAPGLIRYVRAWLEVRSDAPGPLFPSTRGDQGGHFSSGGIWRLVSEVRDLAGIAPFTPHDLRRSFGTHLLAQGKDLSIVRDLMGHANLQTTSLYDRRGEVEKAEAVRSFDALPVGPTRSTTSLGVPRGDYALGEVFAYGAWGGEASSIDLGALQAKLDDGSVTMERITFATRRKYPAAMLAKMPGSTEDHRVLCAEAADWITSKGWTWRVGAKNTRYAGGVADVADMGGRVFVECGYTQVSKILAGVDAGVGVMVVPYLRTNPTISFLFTRRKK
jgi:integrase